MEWCRRIDGTRLGERSNIHWHRVAADMWMALLLRATLRQRNWSVGLPSSTVARRQRLIAGREAPLLPQWTEAVG
jgi:hypothetical protein